MRNPMRILLATDAWEPQVNGVVKTLQATTRELRRRGHGVRVIAPHLFRRAGLPGYPEIEVAWPDQRVILRILADGRPDHIHIATEGPSAGRCAASPCGRPRLHDQLPHALPGVSEGAPAGADRADLPCAPQLSQCRNGVMVATPSIRAELERRGFDNVMAWGRGVDLSGFNPVATFDPYRDLPRPIFLSVGRLAPEKNLEAFLALPLPGTKVVIGDGPAAAGLRARFPDAIYLGNRSTPICLPSTRRRRLRLSEPDRHLRPRADRSSGLRPPGCGLPCAWSPRHRRREWRGRDCGRSRHCGHGGAGSRSVGMPAPRGTLHLVSGNGPVCREPRAGAY